MDVQPGILGRTADPERWARLAADLDYRIVVVSDEVADSDPEVHNLLVTKLFPPQAEVVTGAELTAATAHVSDPRGGRPD